MNNLSTDFGLNGTVKIKSRKCSNESISLLLDKVYILYSNLTKAKYDIVNCHLYCMENDIHSLVNIQITETSLNPTNNLKYESDLCGLVGKIFVLLQYHTNIPYNVLGRMVRFNLVYGIIKESIDLHNVVDLDSIVFYIIKRFDYNLYEPYLFFGEKNMYGYFSNWYPCKFTIDDIEFSNTEQYMMYMKAITFKDMYNAEKILNTDNPKEIKRLGRLVTNYDQEVWSKVRFDVVKAANLAKFTQNPDLKTKLLETGDRYIIECAPRDTIWGIGYSKGNSSALTPSRWRGQNLLGQVLMAVRDIIISDNL